MSQKFKRTLIDPLVRAAVTAAESMPPSQKADVYDGIAHVARRVDPKLAEQAAELAAALREAEALQLHFRNLFPAS